MNGFLSKYFKWVVTNNIPKWMEEKEFLGFNLSFLLLMVFHRSGGKEIDRINLLFNEVLMQK